MNAQNIEFNEESIVPLIIELYTEKQSVRDWMTTVQSDLDSQKQVIGRFVLSQEYRIDQLETNVSKKMTSIKAFVESNIARPKKMKNNAQQQIQFGALDGVKIECDNNSNVQKEQVQGEGQENIEFQPLSVPVRLHSQIKEQIIKIESTLQQAPIEKHSRGSKRQYTQSQGQPIPQVQNPIAPIQKRIQKRPYKRSSEEASSIEKYLNLGDKRP